MRPIEDARRSAEALGKRGFEPVLAPVIAIRATGMQPPAGNYEAVLATSANAFRSLSLEARAALRDLPICVAGERTAAAAKAVGLPDAEIIAPDAAALAAALAGRAPRGARLLYLAGRDRKGDLETALAAAACRVVALEVYVAEARSAWSGEEALAFSTCAAALHYSRRSAELAWDLAARAGLGGAFRTMSHACISQDAAAPLRAVAGRIGIASATEESPLLDALEALLASARAGGQSS
jgi:uroporphyrinogen-III synthase